MWTRVLVVLLVLFGVWYYFNQKKAPAPSTGPAAVAAGAGDCLLFAGRANSSLTSAISAASHPPVDAVEWSRAENEASSAIGTAESACGGSEPALKALSLMRTSLMEIAAGARGEGGTMGVAARQDEIDTLLNRAGGR